MTYENIKSMVMEMFYDYDDSSKQKGALECFEELIGNGYRMNTPYLQAYILKKLLNMDDFYVIQYGDENKIKNIPKYYFTTPRLFFSKIDAYKFARNCVDNMGQPFMIERVKLNEI